VVRPGVLFGTSYLTVPESSQTCFSPAGGIAGGRKGRKLRDLRFTHSRQGGVSGFFGRAEIARQANDNFGMDARAGHGAPGHTFADAKWTSSVSYRPAHFPGDEPATYTFELWHPAAKASNGCKGPTNLWESEPERYRLSG
jgi:hypothetical protein